MVASADDVEDDCLLSVRLLLVDDDEDFGQSIAALLAYYGADVTVASTARQARALLQAREFDLLLSDIEMPVEDGCALMRSVRAMSSSRINRIHAAALTAACDRHTAVAHAAGFNRIIPKTLVMSDLVRVIRDLADSDRFARGHSAPAADLLPLALQLP